VECRIIDGEPIAPIRLTGWPYGGVGGGHHGSQDTVAGEFGHNGLRGAQRLGFARVLSVRGCTGPSICSGGERTRPQSCLLVAQTSGTNWQTVPKAPSPVQSRVIGTQSVSAATDLVGTHLPSRALLWDLRDVHRRRQ
ncbi:hypothetical protein chiPu_0029964, partial [Chiloscyllium punctatum]|nr:hypothetical protein [Chiloscyllium punctatum]